MSRKNRRPRRIVTRARKAAVRAAALVPESDFVKAYWADADGDPIADIARLMAELDMWVTPRKHK